MRKRKPFNYYKILLAFFGGLWILCIVSFVFSFLFGTNFFKSQVTGTAFGKSQLFVIGFVGSLVVGVLSFGLMILTVIVNELIKSNTLKLKKTPLGLVTFPIKMILVMLVLPLFLVYKRLVSKKESLRSRLAVSVIILFILLPVWGGTYFLAYICSRSLLGYNPEINNVVGTGSMYPTWPKGEKGKTPDELASEVVSTAGFLTYPNGIVINGKRYFGYTIQKGDIITAKNDAILKTTSEVYSTPSGVLKRVVALGGDTVELKDGIFYLNDQPQKEQYIAESRSTYGEDFLRECQLYKVPNDSVFLMGDNRKGSGDSREFGPVKYSEIQSVLPLKKQVGTLDKNWHDASNDLADTAKPTIDIDKFVDLLNQKRKENGASPVKHDPKLDASAKIRGEALLKQNTIHTQASYNEVVSAMSKVGYWNSYVWEWSIEGYYNADELIEDYIERDSSDAKDVWFDKKFDDIGIAEVQGTINGCPTQLIVIHAAGYVPPNYKQSDIDSWKKSLDGLNGIRGGWADLKNNTKFYESNKADVDRINDIIATRISRINSIYTTMSANKWLGSEQNQWIKEDTDLYNEQEALANKLNGK
jgi:signal peptidase I